MYTLNGTIIYALFQTKNYSGAPLKGHHFNKDTSVLRIFCCAPNMFSQLNLPLYTGNFTRTPRCPQWRSPTAKA